MIPLLFIYSLSLELEFFPAFHLSHIEYHVVSGVYIPHHHFSGESIGTYGAAAVHMFSAVMFSPRLRFTAWWGSVWGSCAPHCAYLMSWGWRSGPSSSTLWSTALTSWWTVTWTNCSCVPSTSRLRWVLVWGAAELLMDVCWCVWGRRRGKKKKKRCLKMYLVYCFTLNALIVSFTNIYLYFKMFFSSEGRQLLLSEQDKQLCIFKHISLVVSIKGHLERE